MVKITEKIVLNAEPRIVWKFITAPKNFPKYVYGYAHGKIISSNATGIGASYEWYGKFGPFWIKSIEEIIRWKAEKYVAYFGKMFGIKFNSFMQVKRIKKQTQLIVSIKYGVPLYFGGKIMDWLLISRVVKDYVKKSGDNLKKIYAE